MKSLRTLCAFVLSAATGAALCSEKVSFPGVSGDGFASVERVSATLQRPQKAAEKAPAVVILHGSAGIDGRGAFYAERLNAEGFATLEVFMYSPGNAPGYVATLTHAFGALKYLAGRPDVDPGRIGVMGFSAGGAAALRLLSKSVNDAFRADLGPLRFAAHAALYPVCWVHLKMTADTRDPGYGTYNTMTGAPLLLLAGDQDDFDSVGDCDKLVGALPESYRPSVQQRLFAGATHGWDSPAGTRLDLRHSAANQGKGGRIRMYANPTIANESREAVIRFFREMGGS